MGPLPHHNYWADDKHTPDQDGIQTSGPVSVDFYLVSTLLKQIMQHDVTATDAAFVKAAVLRPLNPTAIH